MAGTPQASGRLGALNDAVTIGVLGLGSFGLQASGTWVGTLSFEASIDGLTFSALSAVPTNSTTSVTSTTGNGLWLASAAGLRLIRVRVSAYTSGTAMVELQAADGTVVITAAGGGGGGDATAANQLLGNASLSSIDGKTPALGQALAAASVPIVLTAAQITTLTPPAAIAGYALEAGHLATIDTSTAASKTDLDTLAGTVTSARAAVNPISGQAGVQGASGVVTALTQRVVLATDIALPTGANVIGHVIADTGSTTAVTGNVTVVQATAANCNVTAATQWTGYANATWATNHAPAANTKATITRAAAGGGISNICTGFTVALCAVASAPAAVQITVALIDGASGGSTYLWGPTVISLPAVAGAMSAFAFGSRWDQGSTNTQLTLEFSAAGGANTIQSVSMKGTTK